MAKEEKAVLTIDMAKALAAVARSTEAKGIIEKVTKELEARADANAKRDAYDEGYYYNLMQSEVSTAQQLQNSFEKRYKGAYRTRVRSGTVGRNRYIDYQEVQGSQAVRYGGPVGIVRGVDFKSVWIEFGSLARNPSFCMTRAAESMTSEDIEFTRIYEGEERRQNKPELGKAISDGKRRKAEKRAKEAAKKAAST